MARKKRFRLSGSAPGRPKKGDQDYRDECERVEVERRFSLAKRKCGMGRDHPIFCVNLQGGV